MSGSLEAESVAARRWRIRREEKREKLWKRRDESYLVSKRIVGNGLKEWWFGRSSKWKIKGVIEIEF